MICWEEGIDCADPDPSKGITTSTSSSSSFCSCTIWIIVTSNNFCSTSYTSPTVLSVTFGSTLGRLIEFLVDFIELVGSKESIHGSKEADTSPLLKKSVIDRRTITIFITTPYSKSLVEVNQAI